jgi:hypothetical protein
LNEVQATKPDLNVEALGINMIGEESYNLFVTAARKLPWLQDTSQNSVWTKWDVTYRDVRIVDSLGRLRGVYNLTVHDLSSTNNYLELKQMFLAAARVTDTDKDGLADDWELLYFGNLAAKPADDPDHDGFDNRTEFVFGTNPVDARSTPSWSMNRRMTGPGVFADVTLRRRAGAWLDYLLDASPDLRQWQNNTASLSSPGQSRNLFDGTGCLEITIPVPAANPIEFFRARVVPKN